MLSWRALARLPLLLVLAACLSGPWFDRFLLAALLAQVPLWLYLLSLVPSALVGPRWMVGLVALAAVLALGRPQLDRSGQGELTVLCWNLGVDLPRLDQAAAALRELPWDLALLQEVGLTETHDVGRELLTRLKVPSVARGGYDGELMILSRHRLLAHGDFLAADLREQLWVEAEVRGHRLQVLNLHLVKEDWYQPTTSLLESARLRALQVEDALERVKSGPALVGGDFNLPPNASPILRMRSQMQDSFEQAGRGFGMTFPVTLPCWRIDYLFASSHLEVVDCRVLRLPASDHAALLTRLRLPPPSPRLP